jgi:hypothetical protein
MTKGISLEKEQKKHASLTVEQKNRLEKLMFSQPIQNRQEQC